MSKVFDPIVLADAEALWRYLSEAPTTDAHVDVAIALGSHDPAVAVHAAQFMLSGRSEVLVLTGGVGRNTPAAWESEAGAYAAIAVELGVAPDRIVIEPRARNTGENITYSRDVLLERGVSPRSGILITKPYMQRRAFATALQQWPGVTWYGTAPQVGLRKYLEKQSDLVESVNLLVGDMQRIRLYAAKGFQAPQPMPDELWSALERLVAMGYDKYFLRN